MKIFLRLVFTMLMLSIFPDDLISQTRDVTVTIHLRGVYESKISILGLNNSRVFKPIVEVDGIKNGQTATMIVRKEHLPGEFVMRFDYKELVSSTPYPSEKNLIINQQNLELWVSPIYCNNSDSSYFQKDEIENSTFLAFSMENSGKKEKLSVLQNFLMSYDDPQSAFYQMGIAEYEQRRMDFNGWLAGQTLKDRKLFVSSTYSYQFLPQIPWLGTETDRITSMIEHYFDGIDFSDPLLIRTSFINKWMDNYVNLYGQMATTAVLRDSLFPLAGKRAIEKSKNGNPLVYGWMVDYFYRGYESNGITAGIAILQPYLDDPNCLTSKKQEIERRLKGIETLVPGSLAPPIVMHDSNDEPFDLYKTKSVARFTLLIFWSGDCSHCKELTDQLYSWQQQAEVVKDVMVVAISLDELDTEIAAWQKKKADYKQWKHLRAPDGVRSKVADDYYVLATPVMILIDQPTMKIVALPNTLAELKDAVKTYRP